jgi:carbamoylphosphate synthase small subunit
MAPIKVSYAGDTIIVRSVLNVLEEEGDIILEQIRVEQDGNFRIDSDHPKADVIIVDIGRKIPVFANLESIMHYCLETTVVVVDSSNTSVMLYHPNGIKIDNPADLAMAIRKTLGHK